MPTDLGLLISTALTKAGCVGRDGKTLSTYRAAKLTGVNSRDIGRIISGQVSPSISTLERLFNAVGWEVAVSFFPRKK
jgi:transcriptional regulator with XRE-family HTH domain